MKKLNIAMVCDSVTNPTGGSFISTLRFAELLSKRGHKIIFISAKSPKRPKIDSYKGIKIYRLFSFFIPKTQGPVYISLPRRKQIKKILEMEKIDILHVIMPFPASIQAIRAAKQLKIKVVAHSHTQPENIFYHVPTIAGKEKLNHYFYKYLLWIYKKAEIVICPSKFAEKLLKKRDSTINTTIISNGVDISKFKKLSPASFLKKYNLNEKEIRLLFIGRLHPEKNVKVLIQSLHYIVKKFNNFHLNIVGVGHQREYLEKLAEELGVKDKITFFGKLSEKDLVASYNACDIFVLPSIAELEGMVVLEAMACGKPIIIADSLESASPDFVNKNGFTFQPQNPKELSDKILILLQNSKIRKKMGHESYKQAKKFDINKSIEKLEKVYLKVLG
ncbi:MAG: glycosyltransferase [Candidatus Pacearchaeota archaeon]|jgi:glycosyltransferase involved in cell wall biosynthesis